MYLADTLSRAYRPHVDTSVRQETESINILQSLRVTGPRMEEIREHTKNDKSMQQLKPLILEGWPEHKVDAPTAAVPYYAFRDVLSVYDDIICRGDRVIIPQALCKDMIERIHLFHLGIEGCLRRARGILYWPNMNAKVKEFIESCEVCRTYETKQRKETLRSHDIPDRP